MGFLHPQPGLQPCSSLQTTAMPSRVNSRASKVLLKGGRPRTVRTAARELGLLLVVVLLLSNDELNPVKVLCSYTSAVIGISEVHFTISATALLAGLVVNQRDHILYTCARRLLLKNRVRSLKDLLQMHFQQHLL